MLHLLRGILLKWLPSWVTQPFFFLFLLWFSNVKWHGSWQWIRRLLLIWWIVFVLIWPSWLTGHKISAIVIQSPCVHSMWNCPFQYWWRRRRKKNLFPVQDGILRALVTSHFLFRLPLSVTSFLLTANAAVLTHSSKLLLTLFWWATSIDVTAEQLPLSGYDYGRNDNISTLALDPSFPSLYHVLEFLPLPHNYMLPSNMKMAIV